MLLKAFELANEFQKDELAILLNEEDAEFKVAAVRNLFDSIGVKEICKGIMQEHYSIAKEALAKINIPNVKKIPL